MLAVGFLGGRYRAVNMPLPGRPTIVLTPHDSKTLVMLGGPGGARDEQSEASMDSKKNVESKAKAHAAIHSQSQANASPITIHAAVSAAAIGIMIIATSAPASM
jgi:hypothetical protein